MNEDYYKALSWKGKLKYLWYYYSYDPFGLSWHWERLKEWESRNYYFIGTTIAAILFAIAGMIFFVGFLA